MSGWRRITFCQLFYVFVFMRCTIDKWWPHKSLDEQSGGWLHARKSKGMRMNEHLHRKRKEKDADAEKLPMSLSLCLFPSPSVFGSVFTWFVPMCICVGESYFIRISLGYFFFFLLFWHSSTLSLPPIHGCLLTIQIQCYCRIEGRRIQCIGCCTHEYWFQMITRYIENSKLVDNSFVLLYRKIHVINWLSVHVPCERRQWYSWERRKKKIGIQVSQLEKELWIDHGKVWLEIHGR